MHSVEFKTEIVDGVIKVPQEYKDFQNAYVSLALTVQKDARKSPVTRLRDNIQRLDFSHVKSHVFKI